MTSDAPHAWRLAMAQAVRLAVRGHGWVEPNPMVGCVILDAQERTAGWGWHRRVGGDHAEVEALRRAGERARGGTAVVTLEPCSHHGRTPPCTDALVRAGVSTVAYATRDPNPTAAGGAEKLVAASIRAVHLPSAAADELNAPFFRRVREGRPWISVKWAQTIDGAIATAGGESRWISSERLRRAVHRERGRVDAIMTGIGTVLADDPRLTARHATRRREAMRIVVDPALDIPLASKLVQSAADGPPVLVATTRSSQLARSERCDELAARGVRVLTLAEGAGAHAGTGDASAIGAGLLSSLVRTLAADYGVGRMLVESGGGLVGALLRERLADECWVIIAPRIAGDPKAIRPVRGFEPGTVESMQARRLCGSWRRGGEMLLLYR